MRESPITEAPYKGLVPYSEEDAPFFFGREREREIIVANLMAARLTLIYGTSGVGKSSVLRAGVAHRLQQQALQNLADWDGPELIPVVFSSWRDDPVAGLRQRIQESIAQIVNGDLPEVALPSGSLCATIEAWTERLNSDLYIMLDQFEEYFLYHPQENFSAGGFDAELSQAVNRRGLRVSFIISIREDSLSKLDRFKGRIPSLFDNYVRIEHLNEEATRSAIEKPINQYNDRLADEKPPFKIEPALVDAVVDQVKRGKVMLGDTGWGLAEGISGLSSDEGGTEAPYLQLVMTRLWDEETKVGSNVLRRKTLEDLGGAETIVKRHLDNAMDTLAPDLQNTAAAVFHYLVTPSGTKIAHSPSDLADYAQLPHDQVSRLLDQLSNARMRILRSIPSPPGQAGESRYEIFHDVLAQAILDWRTRYSHDKDLAENRKELLNLKSFLWGWAISITLGTFLTPLGALFIVRVLRRRINPPFSWRQAIVVWVGWITAWYVTVFAAGALGDAYEKVGITAFFLSYITGPLVGGLICWRIMHNRQKIS